MSHFHLAQGNQWGDFRWRQHKALSLSDSWSPQYIEPYNVYLNIVISGALLDTPAPIEPHQTFHHNLMSTLASTEKYYFCYSIHNRCKWTPDYDHRDILQYTRAFPKLLP